MSVKLTTLAPVTISSGGTAVQISNQGIWVTSVTLQAGYNNVSRLQIGDSSVTVSNGIEVPPGDSATIDAPIGPSGGPEEFLLSEIYVNSFSSNDTCRVVCWKKRN